MAKLTSMQVASSADCQEKQSSGFTLLEVILTIAILLTITVAVAMMMRSAIDIRASLSQNIKVTQRINVALTRLATDLEHGFIINLNDLVKSGTERKSKSIFRLETGFDQDKLGFTTMNHIPFVANSGEPDQSFVVYELKDSEKIPGRKDLYRGRTRIISKDFREDPEMKLLARDIKRLKITPWRGDDWSKDRWDSSRSDTRNKIPHMIKIELEAWADEPSQTVTTSGTEITVKIETIVNLPFAIDFKELKPPGSTVRWM